MRSRKWRWIRMRPKKEGRGKGRGRVKRMKDEFWPSKSGVPTYLKNLSESRSTIAVKPYTQISMVKPQLGRVRVYESYVQKFKHVRMRTGYVMADSPPSTHAHNRMWVCPALFFEAVYLPSSDS